MQYLPIISHAIGWTILHTVWQSLIIGILFKLVDAILPKTQAKARYALGLISLSTLFVCFATTFALLWQSVPANITTFSPQVVEGHHFINIVNSGDAPVSGIHSPPLSTLLARAEQYIPMLSWAYSIGLLIMLLRLGISAAQYYQLRNGGLKDADNSLQDLLKQLMRQAGITKAIQLRLSTLTTSPIMTGWIKPIIILPVAMANSLSTEAMEAILLHELAHIKRHDFIINIFQTIAETLLFFNPLSWYLSSYISREREHCCDDLTVQMGTQPLVYAQALATLATESYAANQLALGAAGNQQKSMHLFNRIKRITEMKKQPLNYGRLTALLFITGLIVGIVLNFLPANAQAKKQKVKRIEIVKEQSSTDLTSEYKHIDTLIDIPEDIVQAISAMDKSNSKIAKHKIYNDKLTLLKRQITEEAIQIDTIVSLSLKSVLAEDGYLTSEQLNALTDSIDKRRSQFPYYTIRKKVVPKKTIDTAQLEAYNKEFTAYQKTLKKHIASQDFKQYAKEMEEYAKAIRQFEERPEMKQYLKEMEQYEKDRLKHHKPMATAQTSSKTAPPKPPAFPKIMPPERPIPPTRPEGPVHPSNAESRSAKEENENGLLVIDLLISEKKISPDSYSVVLNEKEMIINGKKQNKEAHIKYYSILNPKGGSVYYSAVKEQSKK